MFPLNTKQFSAAFLDVKRNSQGYNEEVSSVDRDATKKLLRPFHIPQIGPSSIPQCHHLGTMMWNFMWNCARMSSARSSFGIKRRLASGIAKST